MKIKQLTVIKGQLIVLLMLLDPLTYFKIRFPLKTPSKPCRDNGYNKNIHDK